MAPETAFHSFTDVPLPTPSRLYAERRAQLRGLVYLAVLAALFIILRYGPARLFTPGWWRLW